MRLFIAINFDEKTKEKLLCVQRELRGCACAGNFSHPENLHLTVLFLGEVSNWQPLKKIIDECFTAPFELCFDKTGNFRGDIYWVGIRSNPTLLELHRSIRDRVLHSCYDIGNNPRFSPHITLARQVELSTEPQYGFESFSMPVNRLSLMKSERINGRLTYTEIYGKTI